MTVELQHPYEQIAEQIMFAKGAASIEQIVEQALKAMHSGLSEQEQSMGLQGMIQAGLDSGIYEGDIFAELHSEREMDQTTHVPRVEQAA